MREETHLDSEEMVPSLDEVSTEVSGGLADHLHGDVVPRRHRKPGQQRSLPSKNRLLDSPGHTRDLFAVVDVLERLVERVEVENSRVRVVLSRPDGGVLPLVRAGIAVVVDKNVLRSVLSRGKGRRKSAIDSLISDKGSDAPNVRSTGRHLP